jgi:DNA methylase
VITERNQGLLRDGIHCNDPVSGLTHSFYRYPARFSPAFTRAVIEVFTKPGQVVYDPFMGGGTTVVEATVLGRRAVGTDINSLALFLADVKTTVLTDAQIASINSWAENLVPEMNVHRRVSRAFEWAESGYHRNINDRETWRIRKLLEIALASTQSFPTEEEQRFARCVLLRTAQWALDNRTDIPPVREFRNQIALNAEEMSQAASEFALVIADSQKRYGHPAFKPMCLQRSVVGIENVRDIVARRPISLVLTSPPYPGVHVLYHRWQVQGRRETPAPFWIANSLDGNGASFYTFGDRKEGHLDSYFGQALAAFKSLSKVVNSKTFVVQMIAFSEPKRQLPRYLTVMEEAGFAEMRMPELANDRDGRIWRSVPNRKWYASQRGSTPSSSEVVLFHKLSQ